MEADNKAPKRSNTKANTENNKGTASPKTSKKTKGTKGKISTTQTARKELNAIRKRLEEAGVYSPSVDYMVQSCSQLINIRDKLYKELCKTKPITEEISREGDVRFKSHPIYNMYIEYSKEVRQALDALTMTVKSSTVSASDEIDKLNELVKGI